ncbi:UDP-N-acetylglucosamine 2-epimerase (non-hydrolyzing) [Fuchsiella alkaliacetigena]|nr:UDP-N-acetylglucosamine 2-epimerase (non-hydrolyzing) [Fuchsiella alkaliacetigena]
MKKVAIVFGTRPEAIKMAPVIKELKKYSQIELLVIVTAQHRELLDQVLDLFEITPDYDLDIMESKQKLETITTKILAELSTILAAEDPDLILVHGDTTTTFASALAAFYQQIPIGHIEAGLRTHDKYNPFPEEMNRHLSDVLADLYFAPTEKAKNNLLREGVAAENIFVTGNTVIDALKDIFTTDHKFKEASLNSLNFEGNKVVLLTVHRRENIGQPLFNICRAVKEIIAKTERVKVICPVHPNPEIKKIITAELKASTSVYLIEPLAYQDFINLLGRVSLVLTDSGGVQEEASVLGKPLLVLREKTERPEVVNSGLAKLVGCTSSLIVDESIKLLKQQAQDFLFESKNLYGQGKSAVQIAEILSSYF